MSDGKNESRNSPINVVDELTVNMVNKNDSLGKIIHYKQIQIHCFDAFGE